MIAILLNRFPDGERRLFGAFKSVSKAEKFIAELDESSVKLEIYSVNFLDKSFIEKFIKMILYYMKRCYE